MSASTIHPLAFHRPKPVTLHEILSGTIFNEVYDLFYYMHLSTQTLCTRFELYEAPQRYFDDILYLQGTLHQCYHTLSEFPLSTYRILPFRRRATELLVLLPTLVHYIKCTAKAVGNMRPRQFRDVLEDVFFKWWADIRRGFGPLRKVLAEVTHMYVLLWGELGFQEWFEVERVWELVIRVEWPHNYTISKKDIYYFGVTGDLDLYELNKQTKIKDLDLS